MKSDWLDWTFWSLLAVLTAGMLVLQCGCAPRPQAREPIPAVTPWCFRLRFTFAGKEQAAVACAASTQLCASARSQAMKFGGLMKATAIGNCREGM